MYVCIYIVASINGSQSCHATSPPPAHVLSTVSHPPTSNQHRPSFNEQFKCSDCAYSSMPPPADTPNGFHVNVSKSPPLSPPALTGKPPKPQSRATLLKEQHLIETKVDDKMQNGVSFVLCGWRSCIFLVEFNMLYLIFILICTIYLFNNKILLIKPRNFE